MAIEDPKTGRKTLSQVVTGGAFLSAQQAVEAILQLLTLLETLHSEGQIHRNITPETVLLTQNMTITLESVKAEVSLGGIDPHAIPCPPSLRTGRPLLLPAEINAVEDILTQAGILLNPQQIDFYQLGALLCFMVSGHEISDYLRSCRTKADVPKSLRSIIDTALGLNHNDCFPSGKAFADALESLISGDSESKTAVSQLPESIFTESGTNSKPVTAENDQLPFDTLSHYKIIGRIGHGGMGDVYKAYEKSLDRFVAIKVLPAELSRQKDFAKRFQVEAAAVAKLDHPNIVQVYYYGSDNEHHFFVMQYVEGESLAELLARRGKLNVNETLPVIKQCLAGLISVHQNGLIHRDIKPGNLLIDHQSQRALLTDFGIVKSDFAETHLTVTGSILGTVDSIAPEQARGSKVDCRADLYAVGILMYQVLSGKLPFNATSATSMMFQHAYEPPPPLSGVVPGIPKELADIVMKLLAKDPDDRYQTAKEVLTALENIEPKRISYPPRTSIIEVPSLSTVPPLPEKLAALAGSSPLRRLKNLLFDFFQIHTPQILASIQTTTQQVDGTIAQYQRQRDHLSGLLKESRLTASELAEQANANRIAAQAAASQSEKAATLTGKQKALKEKQENEQAVAEMAQLAAEQTEQAEQIDLQLIKVDAKLVQLKSQHDALNARMIAAKARLEAEGAHSNDWRNQRKFIYGILAVLLCCLSAIFVFRFVPDQSYSPVGTWQTVDFVKKMEDFMPHEKLWNGSFYLKGMTINKDGTTSGPWTWKQDYLWHPGDKTKALYTIRQMEGVTYLFLEWLSGDVTMRGQKPKYYVMKKVPDLDTHIITFEPLTPFEPQTSRELLNFFNENHPSNVRTHHYRTKIQDDQLIGYICVDSRSDADAVKDMLKRSDTLKFVKYEAVTQKEFDEYCLLKQVSLSSKYNQKSQPPVIFVGDLPVDGIVINNPNCTPDFVQSLLGPPVRIDHDGKMLRYTNHGFDLWFSGNRHLSEVHLNRGFKGKLDTGISMTSSMQDVFDIYGKPVETIQTQQLSGQNQERILRQKGNIFRIYYGKVGLIFWFQDNEISQIVPFSGSMKQL